MFTVVLKKNEERRLIDGHSWVYANEVLRIDGSGKNGEIVSVVSSDGKFVGKGFINHQSKILVRLISRLEDEAIDKKFFLNKIVQANNLRLSLGYSNNYRVVFAEADNLPALIIDKYADVLSIQLLSLGMNNAKDVIVECLVDIFAPKAIYERSDVAVREKEGLRQIKQLLYGTLDEKVEIDENGVKMLVDVINGQKTGYFLDQKENRLNLRKYTVGKRVLDCFSNSGGFALNAAVGQAKEVVALDISQVAIDNINLNAKANNLQITTKCVDVFTQLRTYNTAKEKFDVIILDPPAFTKSADKINEALKGYTDINLQAIKLLSNNGILVTCSCSHYVSMSKFEEMLAIVSKKSGKCVKLLERRTQSLDHPTQLAMDETLYLKCYVLHISEK